MSKRPNDSKKGIPTALKRQRKAAGFRLARTEPGITQSASSRFITLSQDEVNGGTLRARNRLLPSTSDPSPSTPSVAPESISETTAAEAQPEGQPEEPAHEEPIQVKEKRKRQTKNTVSILGYLNARLHVKSSPGSTPGMVGIPSSVFG